MVVGDAEVQETCLKSINVYEKKSVISIFHIFYLSSVINPNARSPECIVIVPRTRISIESPWVSQLDELINCLTVLAG